MKDHRPPSANPERIAVCASKHYFEGAIRPRGGHELAAPLPEFDMGTIQLTYTQGLTKDGKEGVDCLPIRQFKRFNADILGLGKISQEGEYMEALAAMFDLEGFTMFCNQIDPHLVVPEFLDSFLKWLFEQI